MDGSLVYDSIISDGHLSGIVIADAPKSSDFHEKAANENLEKNSAVWTADSINTLLRLYERKLGMLITPKKKTRIWIAISDNLKDYDIEMSPDQVRWKINALTKKYKQCLHTGHHHRFKYFTELNNIYAQYNLTSFKPSELIHKRNNVQEGLSTIVECEMQPESKAIIELRKNRLADKIESDRCQSKVHLEKQWLEYLKREEEQSMLKDGICERSLQLRQERLELRKRELETRESIDLRRFQLMEKEYEEVFKLRREKCELLKKILTKKNEESVSMCYSGFDWAEDVADRKSTSGYIFYVFNYPLFWYSKKQPSILLSSCEAEYIALSTTIMKASFLRQLLNDFGYDNIQDDIL